MSDDGQMCLLLAAVQAGDDADEPVDNAMLASRLGWPLDDVADYLKQAKERSLVWGRRTGDLPPPWFTELEITVQGRRLLRTGGVDAD